MTFVGANIFTRLETISGFRIEPDDDALAMTKYHAYPYPGMCIVSCLVVAMINSPTGSHLGKLEWIDKNKDNSEAIRWDL